MLRVVRKDGARQLLDLAAPDLAPLGRVAAAGGEGGRGGVTRLDARGGWVRSQLDGFAIHDTPLPDMPPPTSIHD